MSVLEKKGRGKLDDTIPLACRIDSFVNKDGHTEFVLKVQRGPNVDNKWEVQHRYNDFVALNAALTANVGYELPLPPKKAFGNMDSTFLHERRIGLQKFMESLLSNHLFCHHIAVKKFLDPQNYSDEIEKIRQQQAAMFFRSEPNWQLQENLKEIGWRVRKQFFTIKAKTSPKDTKYLLAYVEHGPDMCLDYETSLLALLRQLTTLQHPFIVPVTYASSSEKGSTIAREFHPKGSLRDIILKSKPDQSRIKKYGNAKLKEPFKLADVKRIGRQILEALKFLNDKGWSYGHLHAGNVILDGQQCRLLDIENGILGLSSIYRSFLIALKGVKNLEAVDVYCFGQLLYEIVFGNPLDSASVEILPKTCPPLIKPILQSILSPSAVKSEMPSLDELLADPFFAGVDVRYDEKPIFKVNKLKDALKQCRDAIETRLKEDQKKIRQFQRLSKARSDIMSEEERKKRKRSAKKKTTTADPTTQKPQTGNENTPNPTNINKNSSPAPVAPAPPPAPLPPPTSKNCIPQGVSASQKADKGALLSSISSFSKIKLKSAETNDRSAPKV